MMTQVYEIRRKRHLQMTFPEFQEAISRVAEKLLVQSVGTSQVSFKLGFIKDLDWILKRRADILGNQD